MTHRSLRMRCVGGACTAGAIARAWWRYRFQGSSKSKTENLLVGSGILLLTGLFFALLSFWGGMLWFEELGQSQRFWTAVFAVGGFAVLGALVGGLGVFILTLPIPGLTPLGRVWPALAGALIGALWGCWHWQIILQYIFGVSTGIRDPILQHDTGFYLFTLPFYDNLYLGSLMDRGDRVSSRRVFGNTYAKLRSVFSASSVIAFESSDRVSAHRIFSLPMAAIAAIPGANSRGRLAMAFRLAEVQDTLKTRKNRKPRSLHQSPLKVLSVPSSSPCESVHVPCVEPRRCEKTPDPFNVTTLYS
jgi:Uncharacterised protein family (UPF0182)